MNTAAAQTAVDNAQSLLTLVAIGIDGLPAESRLADGIGLVLDQLGEELGRAQAALA